jgi:hypothetical protein
MMTNNPITMACFAVGLLAGFTGTLARDARNPATARKFLRKQSFE